jgi:hypothetical protein
MSRGEQLHSNLERCQMRARALEREFAKFYSGFDAGDPAQIRKHRLLRLVCKCGSASAQRATQSSSHGTEVRGFEP